MKMSSHSPAVDLEDGLDFLLGHLSGPTFPRNVSTAASHGAQFTVYSKEDVLAAFRRANYVDCRINAYPVYTVYKGINRQEPDFVFIDLDKATFTDASAHWKALDMTLKRIKRELAAVPTVLWSGNGYHVYIPLKNFILEQISEFTKFNEPSVKFLRFAEHWLSMGKSDSSHKPSFKSCLVRIPGTYNSKCVRDGIPTESAKVKIIQRWDGNRATVTKRMLLEFRHELVDEKVAQLRNTQSGHERSGDKAGHIGWIELLLKTPIADFRKNAVSLILAPYLVNIKKMSEEDAMKVIAGWLDGCNKLKPLDSDFKWRAKYSIHSSREKGMKPLKFDTLGARNRQLYDLLSPSSG